MRIIVFFILFGLSSHGMIKNKNINPKGALKLDFDFYVRTDTGFYTKEYTGQATIDNREEVVFSYNNRIAPGKKGIKISIKPFITKRGTHFLVKYYKRKGYKFYLISKSLVKRKEGKDSKIQIVDGDKVYKLNIQSQKLY